MPLRPGVMGSPSPHDIIVETLDESAQRELALVCRQAVRAAPLFRPETPALGTPFRLQMTCLGRTGWVSDFEGYRYQEAHPVTGERWPEIPELLHEIAARHGLEDPDTCLLNVYSEEDCRLGLHQDTTEEARGFPVVTVSLGATAILLLGTHRRRDPVERIQVRSGDVYVLAGPQRLAYHGIDGIMPWTGPEGVLKDSSQRISLTMRKVRA